VRVRGKIAQPGMGVSCEDKAVLLAGVFDVPAAACWRWYGGPAAGRNVEGTGEKRLQKTVATFLVGRRGTCGGIGILGATEPKGWRASRKNFGFFKERRRWCSCRGRKMPRIKMETGRAEKVHLRNLLRQNFAVRVRPRSPEVRNLQPLEGFFSIVGGASPTRRKNKTT